MLTFFVAAGKTKWARPPDILRTRASHSWSVGGLLRTIGEGFLLSRAVHDEKSRTPVSVNDADSVDQRIPSCLVARIEALRERGWSGRGICSFMVSQIIWPDSPG